MRAEPLRRRWQPIQRITRAVAIDRLALRIAGIDNELPVQSLREQALIHRSEGRFEQSGVLLLGYHARWALVGAALVFVMFGLALAALRASRTVAAGISAIACVGYVGYLFELGAVRSSIFSNEGMAIAMAWLPKVVMLLTSIVFLSARDVPVVPDQT